MLDPIVIEPRWIKTTRLCFSEQPSVRLVHISDLHYKGDARYLRQIVAGVKRLAPDVVCFTGDRCACLGLEL